MSKKKSDKDVKISHKNGYGLFNELGASRLKTLFEKLFPTIKVIEKGPVTLMMNCPHPAHKDERPSFYVYAGRNYAKCFACSYYTTNLLELIQTCKGISLKDAATQIQQLTNYKFVSEKLEKQMEDLDVHQKATLAIFYATNKYLQNLINPPNTADYSRSNLKVMEPTLKYLLEERRMKQDWIPYLPFGVMPSKHILYGLVEEFFEQTRTEQYAATSNTTFTKERCMNIMDKVTELVKDVDNSWVGSIVFQTGFSLTTPGRIKLRRPMAEKVENIKVLEGFSPDEGLGYVGLYNPYFNHFSMRELQDFIYIVVEGEFDMLTAQQEELDRGLSNVHYMASGGNANNTDDLYHAGITKIFLLSDHPDPNFGRGEEWLKNRLQTIQELDAKVVTLEAWNLLRANNMLIKDPDECIKEMGYDHFRKIVIDNRAESFVPIDIWASDRAITEGQSFPKTEIISRTNVAKEYGQCVRHPALLGVFVEKVSAALGISAVALRSEIVKAKETEAGYILRIADFIKNEFHLLYKIESPRGGNIRMFHKRTKRFIESSITDGEGMLATFSNVFGDMFLYFRDFIGLPPWKSDANLEQLGNTPLIRDTLKEISQYLKIAMHSVYKGVPSKEECSVIGQGVHYLLDPETPERQCIYINNGRRVYKTWQDPVTNKMEGIELTGPSDGQYLFDSSVEEWSLVIKNIDDVLYCNNISIADIDSAIQDVIKFLMSSWRFNHHELDCMFIAYHLAVCSVHYMFSIKTIVNFLGPTQSGKSTVMSLFAGQFPHLQLVELCSYMSDYTKASVFQTFANSTLCAILEEFSIDYANSSGHKSMQVRNISELIRSNLFERGAVVRRGAINGTVAQYKMKTNVIVSSINLPDDPQDINRRYEIETVRIDDMKDPAVTIFNHITKERFDEIRKIFTVGFLPYAFKLKQIMEDHNDKFNETNFLPIPVQTRFLRNLIPITAIMELLGKPWYDFVLQVCHTRKGRLTAVSKSTSTNSLFERILRTAIIPVESGKRYSVISLLSDPEKVGALNASGCGVYYNGTTKQIYIDWISITSPNGVLNKIEEFNKMPGHALKHTMDQHIAALKSTEYKGYGVFDFLKQFHLLVEEHEISVISVKDLLINMPEEQKGVGITPDLNNENNL